MSMARSFNILLLIPLLFASTFQCYNLCLYCTNSSINGTNSSSCVTCVENAQYFTKDQCRCQSGYYQTSSSSQYCIPMNPFPVWGYFFITILIIVIIGLVIAYYRKVKQNTNKFTKQNLLTEPGGYIATDAGAVNYRGLSQDTNTAIRNPTLPTNQTSGRQPQYVPPPANPGQETCGACKRAGCDCQTSCGHAAHRACLTTWKMQTCPTCQKNIPELTQS